jgi:hypothetical protein
MLTATIDSRRRLTMPAECPAGSPVTVDAIDDRTWIVRRHIPGERQKLVLVPTVDKLTDAAEMDGFAAAAVAAPIAYPEPE